MKRLIDALKNSAISMSVATIDAPVAFADDNDGIEQSADAVIKSILNVVLTIFRYVGIVLLVWGIVQIVLGFRNEDSDSKIRGIMTAVVAIILIFLKTIVNAILAAVGTNDTTHSTIAL